MQVRCPHCNSPVDLADGSSLWEVPCASCGNSFSLIADATTTCPAGTRKLGHFELLEPVGFGGFGTVWKARDTELERIVAVKIPRKNQLDPFEEAKFFREARTAAQLQHPHIVAVHEVGREGDTLYIATDFIEGASLKEWLTARRLTPREAAALCQTIAQALQHAHEAGVVHRDLKPGNIMIDLAGEPHLMDFGLAKRDSGEVTITLEGQVLGTPAYMSPEQARGQGHEADRRVDVYALGVILFELLTGELPFRGDKRMLIVQIVNDEPISPRKLRSNVPRDLETICLKCLQKDPADRYATAQQLADDLGRFLRDEPIRARPVGKLERLWRWCRRNPRTTAAAACVVAAVAAAVVSVYQARVAEHHRQNQAEQLLAEKRQNALERALLLAMSGDFQGAERPIAEAELLGASTGQVRLLRGLIAYHRGETVEAIEHLEQALQLIPDSVATRAILAMAYYHSGRTVRLDEVLHELETMSASSPEDYLFKGQLDAMIYPGRSVASQNLDEAVRRRDSVVARVVRAEARANRALFASKLADAEAEAEGALKDGQVARAMLPDNPFVLAQSVYAQLVASVVYEDVGRRDEAQRLLAQAGRDVKALQGSSSPIAVKSCFWYYEYIGDDDAACDLCKQGTEFRLVPMLYRRGELTQALEAADRALTRNAGLARVERGFVLADLPDGPARAEAAFREARHVPDVSRFSQLSAPLLLRFLGRKKEAVEASLQINRAEMPAGYENWYLKYLDFHCALITADELLKLAEGSRLNRCEAHFAIALDHLAEGDRKAAREHFQKCSQTRAFIFWDWIWARVFLARMDKDPAWPPWVPSKK
jgi:tetratricopeptide (TPR) repeat protein